MPEPDGVQGSAGALLKTDGYAAYAHYAKSAGLTHAQCWAHARKKVYEAKDIEPQRADVALERVGALYAIEAQIREWCLKSPAKRAVRIEHA